MTALLVAVGLAAVSWPAAAGSARLARLPARTPLVARRDGDSQAAARLDPAWGRVLAGAGAMYVLGSGTRGDILVGAALVVAACLPRGAVPAAPALLVAGVAAVRAHSTSLADIGGAGAVLGPGVSSSSAGVATSAAGALVAGALTIAAVLASPGRRRRGRPVVFGVALTPAAVAAGMVPLAIGLLAVTAATGPAAVGTTTAVVVRSALRGLLALGVVVVGALVRRAVPRVPAWWWAVAGGVAGAASLLVVSFA